MSAGTLLKGSVFEHDRLGGRHVGCDASEGRREIVERLHPGVGERDLAQQKADLVAGIEPAGKVEPTFQTELELTRVAPSVLLTSKGLEPVRGLAKEQKRPIDFVQ